MAVRPNCSIFCDLFSGTTAVCSIPFRYSILKKKGK